MPTLILETPTYQWTSAPGAVLQHELDARGMSQAQLAARTGLSPKHVNLVIKGTAPISADVAVLLEDVLDTPAETWLRLEATYQATEARKARTEAQMGAAFLTWAAEFPRHVLLQRGIITAADNGSVVVAKLLDFFGVTNPAAFAKTWLDPIASYRRSQSYQISPHLTALWIRLVEVEAEAKAADAPAYDPKKLALVAKEIPALTRLNVAKGFRQAQKKLLSAGVVLVFVDEVESTRIQGVSRFIGARPVIAVTSRHRYFDSMWFTVLHEIAHLLLHPKRATFLELERAKDNLDDAETAADVFAGRILLPEEYEAELQSATSVAEIEELADEIGVSPASLAGRFGHMTSKWPLVSKMRPRGNLGELLSA